MSKPEEQKPPAANSKYDESFAPKSRLICAELGATEKDLAEIFGVTDRTIRNWKNRFPEFSQAVEEGKESFDSSRVERSLLQAALGAEYEEIHEQDGKVVKKVTRHKAPDIKACMFWLKNRQPQRWRDKTEMAQELGDDLAQLLNEAKARMKGNLPACKATGRTGKEKKGHGGDE